MKDKKLFEQATELLSKNKAPYMMIQKEDDRHLCVSLSGTGNDMTVLLGTLLDEILCQSNRDRILKIEAGIRLKQTFDLIMKKNYTEQEVQIIDKILEG